MPSFTVTSIHPAGHSGALLVEESPFVLDGEGLQQEQEALRVLPEVQTGRHLEDGGIIGLSCAQIAAVGSIFQGRGVFRNSEGEKTCIGVGRVSVDVKSFEMAMRVIGMDRFTAHGWRHVIAVYREMWNQCPEAGVLAALIAKATGHPCPLSRAESIAAVYSF